MGIAAVGLRLLPLQRNLLRTLLKNGPGDLALAVELEFEDGPAGILEARLCSSDEGFPSVGTRLHEQCRPFAAEGRDEPFVAVYSPT